MGKIHVYVPLVFGWVASAIQGYVLDSIAVTTWKGVKERVDVFALTDDESGYTSISHKYHTPYGWEPWEGKFENLGRPDVLLSPQRSAPTAISWSTDDSTSINLFIVDHWGKPWHRYWSGSQWEPAGWARLYNDSTESTLNFTHKLAATSWRPGRIDLVGRNASGAYLHKYFDGSAWSSWEEPWPSQDFSTPPSVVSSKPDRFDVFGIANHTVLHQYWNGKSYLPQWESLHRDAEAGGFRQSSISTSTWGADTLAAWAIGEEDGHLWYTFWNGDHYQGWQNLGGNFEHSPSVVHWSPDRIDIIAHSVREGTPYRYKYWTGRDWQPGPREWLSLGGQWSSLPAAVSWAPGNLDIFGIDDRGALQWQMWNENYWYPEWQKWEGLGSRDAALAEEGAEKQQVLDFKQDV